MDPIKERNSDDCHAADAQQRVDLAEQFLGLSDVLEDIAEYDGVE